MLVGFGFLLLKEAVKLKHFILYGQYSLDVIHLCKNCKQRINEYGVCDDCVLCDFVCYS